MRLVLGGRLCAVDDPRAAVGLRFDQEGPGPLHGGMRTGQTGLAESIERQSRAEGVALVGPEPAPAPVRLLSRQNFVAQRVDLARLAKSFLDQQPRRVPLAADGRIVAVGRCVL